MDKDLISIIVPVYNVIKYLRHCIESIVNQTYTNLEIILVDDGSNDESEKVCDEYKNKDSRIIVIHQENRGLSAARNAGLDICKGKYISFVDSDDYIEPDFIECLYSSIIENSVKVSMCNINYVDENSQIIGTEKWDNIDIMSGRDILKQNKDFIHSVVCNKLYSIEIWKDLRFPIRKNI